jgi:hypothetical protein
MWMMWEHFNLMVGTDFFNVFIIEDICITTEPLMSLRHTQNHCLNIKVQLNWSN